MTAVLDGPGTATSTAPSTIPSTMTGPTVRTMARSARGPALLIGLLVLAGVLVAALRATGDAGYLDPDAYDPSGAHALRALLEDADVSVVRLAGTAEVVARATDRTTVVVAVPGALGASEVAALDGLPGELVLVGAESGVLDQLGLPVETRGSADVEGRRPACDLPAAVRAGEVDLGGQRYAATAGATVTSCYASGGAATLLRLPDQRTTLVGSGDFLTNDALDEKGNAALGLGLLGAGDSVLWVVPNPLGADLADEGPSLWSLYDMSVRAATLGLVLFACVLALWRARRLGRVVVEPLPVVVRAAEAVEGRSRLYRAAGARGQAAEALRAGTRDRLTRRLGLPLDTGRAALVDNAATRCGRDAAGVDALLYGAAPVDDAALVRLADDLDTLTLEVARS